MKLEIYQVDAFSNRVFSGNPAAVVPLKEWLNEKTLQNIAQENNLSETAFFVKNGEYFELRWFTPLCEVDMCGHATLASAYVIFNELNYKEKEIRFLTKSGELKVQKEHTGFSMDFPILQSVETKNINDCFNIEPIATYKSMDYIFLFNTQKDIENLVADKTALENLDLRGAIAMAKGDDCDFVIRFFAPKLGILEDPVTGSAYTQIVTFWQNQLNKSNLYSRQLSKRGGELWCKIGNSRVKLIADAKLYLKGEISI